MTPVVLVTFAIWFILFVAFESNHWRSLNKIILIICTQKDRSLKLRSNFLSSCKPLGTTIQFILFYKCSHFNPATLSNLRDKTELFRAVQNV